MSRLHKRFADEAEAQRFATAIDRRWGMQHGGVPLPRLEDESVGGRRIGRGPHGPWPMTERYLPLVSHPERSEWAYPVDDYVQTLDGERVRLNGDEVLIDLRDAEPLTGTWERLEEPESEPVIRGNGG